MVAFVVLLVVFLTLKYVIKFIIPDVPHEAIILNRRHKFKVERTVKGFRKGKSSGYKPARVNLNVGGVVYDHLTDEKDNLLRGPDFVVL